jgi:hypothetical protein
MTTPPEPWPWLTYAIAFMFTMSGLGIFSVCHALARRIRYGKEERE